MSPICKEKWKKGLSLVRMDPMDLQTSNPSVHLSILVLENVKVAFNFINFFLFINRLKWLYFIMQKCLQ